MKTECKRCGWRMLGDNDIFGLCYTCRSMLREQHYDENHRKKSFLEILFGSRYT